MAADRVWIWCEDWRQERFVRTLLTERFHIDKRRVRFFPAPVSKCASQWVIKQAPMVFAKARATRHQAGLAFMLIVDGDDRGRADRMSSLFGGSRARPDDDRIVACIPCWNIETWLLWLCRKPVDGREVDESRSYKESVNDRDVGGLVGAAVSAWEPPRPEEKSTLPSLSAARDELRRMS